MNPDILIVVAALDEADRISSTLAALAVAFPGAPVWVADDGSTDATPELAREAGATVVRSARVIGKGQAMTAGVQAALASVDFSEPIVVLCDGDLGDSARELPALVDALQSGDAESGGRLVHHARGRGTRSRARLRRLGHSPSLRPVHARAHLRSTCTAHGGCSRRSPASSRVRHGDRHDD